MRGALRGHVDSLARGMERNWECLRSPWFESLPLGATSQRFWNDYCNWTRIDEYRAFVYDSESAEMCARVMASPSATFYVRSVRGAATGRRAKGCAVTTPRPYPNQPTTLRCAASASSSNAICFGVVSCRSDALE